MEGGGKENTDKIANLQVLVQYTISALYMISIGYKLIIVIPFEYRSIRIPSVNALFGAFVAINE